MTNLHIALLTPWERQGGIATYSTKFADALEDVGVDVTPVPVVNTDSANPFEFVKLVSAIPDEADVVHVQFEAGLFGQLGMSGVGAPAFFIALSRLELPVVTTLHEIHAKHPHRGVLGDSVLRARDFVIERLALRASDATVVHTNHAREILHERHGEDDRIERMLHPADSNVESISKERAKDKLNIDGPMLLTFGFVEEKKRYQDVIQALPDFPDVTYFIAGGYRESKGRRHAEECRKLARELGVGNRVRFDGYVRDEDVPIVFSAADIVVLPYGRVSQSGVLNDALAHRKLVIASSLPAFREVEAEYGCLLTYENEPELKDTLQSVLTGDTTVDRLQLRAGAYTSDVSWPQFAAKTENIYEGVSKTD